eukprot:1143703-Pelagomonas_calceolata.AAC.3
MCCRVEELATRVMSGMLEGQGEALLKNYALVLQFLLRLRQVRKRIWSLWKFEKSCGKGGC